jgi:hypothetical protein
MRRSVPAVDAASFLATAAAPSKDEPHKLSFHDTCNCGHHIVPAALNCNVLLLVPDKQQQS